MKVVRNWNMFSRETVDAPSVEVFKAGLDGALDSIIYWKVSLPVAGVLELDGLYGPFQPKLFYELFYEF